MMPIIHGRCIVFQSTPLLRGATVPVATGAVKTMSFNPRPSCEGRHDTELVPGKSTGFNPRPSCEGRHWTASFAQSREMFQSTPLLRGATQQHLQESM